MVGAVDAILCTQCGSVSPTSESFHGWCLSCMTAWRDTADPVMLAQAAAGYAPKSCIPAPSDNAVSRILEFLAIPKDDKQFIPLLLFRGNGTIGRMQALWNFCKTMELLDLKTTAEVLRLSQASHDLTHRCGLHAPPQRSALSGFMSRVFNADFAPLKSDPRLHDYMRSFASDNKLWLFQLTPISSTAEWKTRRAWRQFPRLKHKPMTEHWPFLHKEAARDHLHIMMVDQLVPKGIPEQWRQDMCQDLFVAILTGELKPEHLSEDGARHYIKKVWREHPYKYGPLSLQSPAHEGGKWAGASTQELVDILAATFTDGGDSHCCGDEKDPIRLAPTIGTLGDLLRDKNNGVAVPDLRMPEPYVMDEDIADVYESEVNKRTDRTERGWSISKVAR